MRRRPRALASSTSASSASRQGTPSAAGDALQMLPPSVPAFWICMPPTSRAASLSPSNRAGSGCLRRSDQVVSAPMRHSAPSRLDAAQRVEPADVEDILAQRPPDASGIEIRAAGQHREPACGQRRQRFLQAERPQIQRLLHCLARLLWWIPASLRPGTPVAPADSPWPGQYGVATPNSSEAALLPPSRPTYPTRRQLSTRPRLRLHSQYRNQYRNFRARGTP